MNFETNTKDIRDILVDSSFILPISFAVWKLDGDEIFISNKLKLMISATSNFLNPYDFVKIMQRSFGSFLNIAVEKISNQQSVRNDYISSINILGEEFSLKLSFNKEKQIYVFSADNSKKIDSKDEISEIEKILDALPIYVWQKNKDLKITYCNKAYANAMESSKDYIISNNIKLISPSKRDSVYVDQSLYSSKPKKIVEHVVINGSRRLLAIEESPFLGNDKSTGIAIDITDKEQLETNYKNYKKQTEEVLDNISVPIAIFDEETILVFANAATIKLFSIDGLDLYRNCKFSDIMDYLMSNESIISSSDILKYKDATANLFQTIIEPHHATIHLKNGNTMAVTISPNRGGGLIFMFEDISDKVALEREVNSISAIQIETLDHLAEGVMVFGADNLIKIINPAANNIWEKNKNFIGIHINEFFKSSANLFNSEMELKLLTSKLVNMATQRMSFSEKLTLLSGRKINYSYIPLPDGLNLIKFVDISDRTNLERALKEKTDMASQIDKLKSNLVSNISYELRAPLQTINGFAEILYNKYFGELNEKQMEYCYGISTSVARVTEVVDAIISLANIEAGQMKIKYAEVNLLDFIKDSIALFNDRATIQGISISTDFADSSFTVFIDEQSMKQAIFQLISKSMKITPLGGKILISVTISEPNSDYFNLIINDNGLCLTDEELDRTKKTLLNDSNDGSVDRSIEFGLLLANNIVRLHNGKISIDSEKEIGNTISCCIPVKQFLQ